MNDRKLILVIILAVLIFPTVYTSSIDTIPESIETNGTSNPPPVGLDLVSAVDPFVDELTTDLLTPGTADNVVVTAPIYDLEGIDNASLHWTYDTLNTTVFNASMALTTNVVITQTTNKDMNNVGYPTTSGYLTSYGLETNIVTSWRYTYFELSMFMSDFRFNLYGRSGNSIVYYTVETFNLTSNQWQQELEAGGTCCTSTNIGTPTHTYNDIGGIRIYTVSYDSVPSQTVNPGFSDIRIRQDQYDATIMASNIPSFISYWVNAYDLTGNMTTSSTNNILMNDAPSVAFNNLQTVAGGDQNLLINVTVTEPNNITTLDTSKTIAYYKLANEMNWNMLTLNLVNNTSNFTAIYTNSLTLSQLGTGDSTLDVMVNATDVVGGVPGYTGTVSNTITVDNNAPTLQSLKFDPRSPLVNSTPADTGTQLEATFDDPSGIRSASIFYSNPDNTSYTELVMINQTNLVPNTTPEKFDVVVPGFNESSTIYYYFRVTDFLNNTGNTNLIMMFVDADGPLISNLLIYPPLITNTTDVTILFDTADSSGISQTNTFYSFDNGTSWAQTSSSSVTYTPNPIETFDMVDFITLPLYLNTSGTSYAELRVNQTTNQLFQRAFLHFVIDHELSTDVRVWINVGGEDYLVFDRDLVTGKIDVTIDLIDLGVDKSYFKDSNFTLIIEDFAELYVGSLETFTIQLVDYTLPFGYGFKSVITAPNNDTQVLFFVQSIDVFLNVRNSTIFSYYADGKAPQYIVTAPSNETLDLSGSTSIDFEITAFDSGGLQSVEIFYRFSVNDTWKIKGMKAGINGSYTISIPITSADGNISYYFKIIDTVGLSNRTAEFFIVFSGGGLGTGGSTGGTSSTPQTTPPEEGGLSTLQKILLFGGIPVLIAGAAAAIYYLRKKGKLGKKRY